MKILFNLKDKDRKALVQAVSEVVGEKSVYLKAPTYAYKIGAYEVNREGVLLCPEDNLLDLRPLLNQMEEKGFVTATMSDDDEDIDSNTVETEVVEALSNDIADNESPKEKPDICLDEKGDDHLIISIPKERIDNAAFGRLMDLIASKRKLIEHALGTSDLSVIEENGRYSFPWFTLTGFPGEAMAYSQFVCALIDMAVKATRISAAEKPLENEKFAMRIFMVRLGMKGEDYKPARKLLMKNLTGNSAWKNGMPSQSVSPAPIEPETVEGDNLSDTAPKSPTAADTAANTADNLTADSQENNTKTGGENNE